jgi:O-antigen biosynthesis protein WbqV
MIRLSGYRVGVDIPIDIVGARPGEKFKEELRTPDEEVLTTYHPYINQLIPITVPPEGIATSLEQLREAAGQRDAAGVRGLVFAIAATSGSPRYVESNADGDVGLISADPGSATDDGALEPLAAESTADSSAQVPA